MGMFDQTMQMQQPYGMPMGGYQYNGIPQPQVKVNNVLTPEEIQELKASQSQFSLGLTERESKQAACTHRSADGMTDTLVYDAETGVARCTICGYQFRPIEPDVSPESIKDAADRLVDILQTIKIMYQDIPAASAREYFQIIPLIGKVPQLFEFAAKDMAKHEYNAWSYNNRNMGGIAMLGALNNILGANPAMYQQQPMMGQPAYNPYMAAPQQPAGYPQQQPNPFGYPGASAGYQPQTQGFQYNPGTPVPPVAPQAAPAAPTAPTAPSAPAEGTPTTVTQKVTV